jgi:cytochrome c oxidase assembly protein subunit 15
MSGTTQTTRAVATRTAPDLSGVLTVGFAMSVAMWAVGYFCRLPVLLLPSPVVLVLLLGCLFVGGVVLGRLSGAGWAAGGAAGLVSGLLNLLILGSLLTGEGSNQVVPSALWWVPGSIVASALLAGLGSAMSSRTIAERPSRVEWLNAFVWVAVAATALLLAAGGLVTSAEAGLAVDDWPTSFGYNMFLYPFSKMTGGIYYEHAHRLLGALVGLTTLVLAFFAQFTERRLWVRMWIWAAVPTVMVQGILGGIRVTDRNLGLAMLHGVLAQVFFAALVALAVVTSGRWSRATEPLRRATAQADRALGAILVILIIVQLVLGASQRHFQELLLVHMVLGLALVAPLALFLGLRAWGLNRGLPFLQRLGLILVSAVAVQVLLGVGALIVTAAADAGALSREFDLVIATAHQWFGAILLATAVVLFCWNFKLLGRPQPE